MAIIVNSASSSESVVLAIHFIGVSASLRA